MQLMSAFGAVKPGAKTLVKLVSPTCRCLVADATALESLLRELTEDELKKEIESLISSTPFVHLSQRQKE